MLRRSQDFLKARELKTLATHGSAYLLLGKAFSSPVKRRRGDEQIDRARKILVSAVNKPLELEAIATPTGVADAPVLDTNECLVDSTVALLELAGHPHILAHEAVVLLREANCAQGIAIVAAGERGRRVVEAEGWSPQEALAAAADERNVTPVGLHRDETWQIARRAAGQPRRPLHAGRHPQAGRHRGHPRPLPPRRKAARRALAGRGARRRPESIWASEQTAELLRIARRIAPTPLPVLLTGETGTGKEMLARAIHRASDRADRPLVPFNCTRRAARHAREPAVRLPQGRLHRRRRVRSRASSAPRPAARCSSTRSPRSASTLQPKLLRFLETHEVHPLGEPQPIKVDVRVIAATNANLEQLVADGRFREDLFYRLNVSGCGCRRCASAARRSRRSCSTTCAASATSRRRAGSRSSDETLEYLLLYSWPGNVRQLANEVRRMVALAEPDATLTPALLSPEIQASRRTIPACSRGDEPEIRVRLDQPLPTRSRCSSR